MSVVAAPGERSNGMLVKIIGDVRARRSSRYCGRTPDIEPAHGDNRRYEKSKIGNFAY